MATPKIKSCPEMSSNGSRRYTSIVGTKCARVTCIRPAAIDCVLGVKILLVTMMEKLNRLSNINLSSHEVCYNASCMNHRVKKPHIKQKQYVMYRTGVILAWLQAIWVKWALFA